ncbi:MAG: hypothetical protein KJO67_02665 [Silicimonas sp.]|nr:hypothetical protein [Silicimonas sp.]
MALCLGRRIYRERRRLILVTALAFLAGYIFYLRVDQQIWGVPIPVLTGAVYAGVVGPAALFFCLVMPSIRFMIEAVAVSRLLFSVFVFSVPDIGYRILASPLLTAFIVVTGGIFISRLIHGRISKRKAAHWRERISLSRIVTRAPARLRGRVWQHRFVGWIDDAQPVAA